MPSQLDKEVTAKVSGTDTAEEPIALETARDLNTTWTKEHNFTLMGERLLSEVLQNKLHKEVTGSPKKFGIYQLESLRLLIHCGDIKNVLAMMMKPGQPVTAGEVVADEVKGSFEISIRGRALFTTVACTSIKDREFFDYGDAGFISERLLRFVHAEFKGRRPPLSFFVHAWNSTMVMFSEGVRLEQPLKRLVRETSSWEHHWTMWSPGAESSGGTSPDIPRAIQAQSKGPSVLQGQDGRRAEEALERRSVDTS